MANILLNVQPGLPTYQPHIDTKIDYVAYWLMTDNGRAFHRHSLLTGIDVTGIHITATVAADGSLQYEDLYTQFVSLQATRASEPIIVDMQAVQFAYVDSLLALTCIARLWHRWSGHTILLQGLHPKVHRYLERMDLFSQCSRWLKQERLLDESERFERKPHSERLLEITPIPSDELQNASVVREAVQRIRAILDTATNRDAQTVGQLCTMLSEITQNVVHSLDEGFAIVQRYRTSGNSSLIQNYRVMISVVDLGIGIENSLRRSQTQQLLDSGSDYIIKALELGVTSRASAGGIGLYQVRRLVQEWQGTMTIRSQRSRVQIQANGIICTDDLPEIPGTHVTIEVQGT
jgi:hypothetical protein